MSDIPSVSEISTLEQGLVAAEKYAGLAHSVTHDPDGEAPVTHQTLHGAMEYVMLAIESLAAGIRAERGDQLTP